MAKELVTGNFVHSETMGPDSSVPPCPTCDHSEGPEGDAPAKSNWQPASAWSGVVADYDMRTGSYLGRIYWSPPHFAE